MHLSRSALVLALAVKTALGQSMHEQNLAEYQRAKQKIYFEAGQRHLRIGSWCRDQGLIPQATSHFLRAVEISEGHNPGAHTVLNYMRALDDRFWLGERKRPSKGLLQAYNQKAAAAEREVRVDKMKLAQHALRVQETETAHKLFFELVTQSEKPPELDDKGRLKLVEGLVPAEVVAQLQASKVTVNGKRAVRDEVLAKVPKLENLRETVSADLALRTDLDPETTAGLHALASALLPKLESQLDGKPTRRLNLLVFKNKSDHETYMAASGRGNASAAPGLCDYGAFTTIVCAEGLAVEDLHALTLHELSHLYFFGTAPAVMPDWYAEGFAESFGGQGTFQWDGKTLTVGGLLRADRLADLKGAPMPIRDFLAGDALQLLITNRAAGLRFYAQAWAFARYLRSAAKPEWREKFGRWENMCRGIVIGALPGKVSQDASEAQRRFMKLFEDDLPKLETEFLAWMAQL